MDEQIFSSTNNFIGKDIFLLIEKNKYLFPITVNIKAINEVWRIIFTPIKEKGVSKKIDFENNILTLNSTSSFRTIKKNIREFFYFIAYEFFEKRIEECSKIYNIELKENLKLKIMSSSCTAGRYSLDDVVSLNCRLIFFPIHLIDLIIVHELCHATHLNHSKDFYKLHEEKMPDYKARNTEQNNEWRLLSHDLLFRLYL